ncbi:hypothetical protein VP01_457g3 [Puccinia sorghi]|uniref:Uncharacterized protein n=1 Tax=Puccinia sorghi TaxID=27349 RepID=A0A0L6UNM0_9BASI|nr:hypothetical protein VP01_457g3 [Puccinia sorghi]
MQSRADSVYTILDDPRRGSTTCGLLLNCLMRENQFPWKFEVMSSTSSYSDVSSTPLGTNLFCLTFPLAGLESFTTRLKYSDCGPHDVQIKLTQPQYFSLLALATAIPKILDLTNASQTCVNP